LKAFQIDYRNPETEYSKQLKAEMEQKQAEEEAKQQQLEKEKEQRKLFEKWKIELVFSRLKNLPEKELSEQKQDFIDTLEANPLFSKMLQRK
jgi:hypothetical protein